MRELKDIEAEYAQNLVEAGNKQYMISIFSLELDELNKKLRALNNEGHEVKKAATTAANPVNPESRN